MGNFSPKKIIKSEKTPFPEKGDKKSFDINLLEIYSDSSSNLKHFDNKFLFVIFPLSSFLILKVIKMLIMEI